MPENPAYERLIAAQQRREEARSQNDAAAQILAARDCGQAHFELGEAGLAARLFSEAAQISQQSGHHRHLLSGLLGMSGRAFQRTKDFQRSLQKYREAASAAAHISSPLEQLRWMGKEAAVLLDLEESFLDMIQREGRNPAPEVQARIDGIRQAFQPETALPKMQASVVFGRSQLTEGDQKFMAELAFQLGRLANRMLTVDKEKAKEIWREAFELLDQVPRDKSHFLAAINHALFLTEEKEYYSARIFLEEAEEMAIQLGLPQEDSLDLVLRLGSVLRQAGHREMAGDRLVQLLPNIQHPVMQAELLTDAINAYFEGSLWAKMEKNCQLLLLLRERYFQQAQGLSRKDLEKMGASPPGIFQLYMLTATALRGLGKNEEALEILTKAQNLAKKGGNRQALHSAKGQAALSLLDMKDYPSSAHISGEMWEEGVRSGLLARSYLEALIGADELDKAEAVRDDYLTYGDDRLLLTEFNARLADAGRGDPAATWKAHWEAGEARRDLGAVALALSRIIEIHKEHPAIRLEAAWKRLRLIEKARPQVKDLFSEASWQEVTPLQKEFKSWLDDFLKEAIDQGEHSLAIYELERFRAQYLVNLLALRRARWDPEQAEGLLDANRAELPGFIMMKSQGGYDLKDRVLTKIDYSHRVYRAQFRLEQLAAQSGHWKEKRDAARELGYWENLAFSAGEFITTGDQGLAFPADLEEYLGGSELQKEEGLLFLHVAENETFAWLIKGSGELHFQKINSFDSKKLEQAHQNLFGQEATGSDRGLAWKRKEQLKPYDQTVKLLADLNPQIAIPIAEMLSAHKVARVFIISGTDLANVPLNACPAIFEKKLECCFLPSGHLLPFIRKKRQPKPEALFLVDESSRIDWARERQREASGKGVLMPDPTQSLQYAPLEAAAVQHTARDYSLKILTESALSKGALEAESGRASWVYLISHGHFDNNNPYQSGMYLSQEGGPDSVWSVAEVFSEVVAPFGRLAVLSGCETSRVKPNVSSEDISLPTAWLAAGFAAVIGSRWPVDDRSTALLMHRFFELWLKGGKTAASALDQSAAWLQTLSRGEAIALMKSWQPEGIFSGLEEGPEFPFQHPRYWAAFFIAGDGAILEG